MNSKRKKFLTRIGMLAVVAFLVLPISIFAQGSGRGRDGIRNLPNSEDARRIEELRRRRAADGKLDLRGLIDEIDAVTVEVSGDMWLNVNTPADLQKAERLL